jgi:hypothetical protein
VGLEADAVDVPVLGIGVQRKLEQGILAGAGTSAPFSLMNCLTSGSAE